MTKPEPESRDIVINEGEYVDILAVARGDFRDLLVVAWETGARPRELITVEARHVQIDQGRWVFPKKQAKGKRQPRAVYLTDAALEITRRMMAQHPDGPLFRNAEGLPWNRWAINNAFVRLRATIGRRLLAEPPEAIPRYRAGAVAPEER